MKRARTKGVPTPWGSLLSCFLLLSTLQYVTEAAHSRRRMIFRRETGNYDRSITTFSADGRLAQVEYGMEASLRGASIAAVKFHSESSSDNNDNENNGICLVIQNSSFGKVHRIDHHLWIVTAGISGDARILADSLREVCQDHRLAYGEAPNTKQVARMAGELQHRLTRTPGARPLGCTAIIVGIDPSPEEGVLGQPRLFQTDPGGIVEECSFCAAGKGRDNVGKEIASLVSRTKESDGNNQTLNQAAAGMAEKVLEQLDDPKGPSVDVWTIRPNPKRRGCTHATCYRGIDKNSLSTIRDRQ